MVELRLVCFTEIQEKTAICQGFEVSKKKRYEFQMNFSFQVPLIISYYTKNTPYEKEVVGLIESCKKFDLECHVEGVADRGSWEDNCAYKPYFIREKMVFFQRPLLWVDADAVFLKAMEFEEFMFSDLSALYDLEDKDPRFAAFAGTVYVNATAGGKEGLDLWCSYSDEIFRREGKAPAYSDQASLYFAILSQPSFHLTNLPPQYGKIFDRKVQGLASKDIVIEHYQASRKLRKKEI